MGLGQFFTLGVISACCAASRHSSATSFAWPEDALPLWGAFCLHLSRSAATSDWASLQIACAVRRVIDARVAFQFIQPRCLPQLRLPEKWRPELLKLPRTLGMKMIMFVQKAGVPLAKFAM